MGASPIVLTGQLLSKLILRKYVGLPVLTIPSVRHMSNFTEYASSISSFFFDIVYLFDSTARSDLQDLNGLYIIYKPDVRL